MNKLNFLYLGTLMVALAAYNAPALAIDGFDEDVTPDVIFGTGNDNGSFTTKCVDEIELGARCQRPQELLEVKDRVLAGFHGQYP